MKCFNIRGKRVNIHNDNRIFIDGRDTKMRLWNNSSTKYINVNSRTQIKEINGMDLESALYVKGWL